MKVRNIMTEPPLTCTPETSLAVAARLMREADYGTLPVVDSAGRLVGIITDRDICLAMAGTTRNALNIAVREAMTQKTYSALLDDDIHSALATMKGARVRRLPVRDGFGHLKGMLSIEDIVVRGLESNGVAAQEIIDALRTMYVRLPIAVEGAPTEDGFTPG
jgi:CBS domain-containing protein